MRNFLKEKLSISNSRKLKNLWQDLLSIPYRHNLSKLGRIYGTDKIGEHFYTTHYMLHLKKFKYKRLRLLEIGVGGYADPNAGGNSLRMWKRYFPFGRIYGLDLYDKSALQEKRIKIFQGSQVDEELLNEVDTEIGGLDVIIDDGSHINEHVIKTFNVLFPKLKEGGVYIVEDTQTSYWEDFGGDSKDLNNPSTMTNYFKALTDSLNNQEFLIEDYQQSYFDRKIISLHFYHNLIFIYKGNNDEKSNMVIDNKRPSN